MVMIGVRLIFLSSSWAAWAFSIVRFLRWVCRIKFQWILADRTDTESIGYWQHPVIHLSHCNAVHWVSVQG